MSSRTGCPPVSYTHLLPLYRSQYACIGVSVEFEAHKDGVFPRPFFARVTLCHSINSLLRFPLDMVYNITSGRPAFAQAVAPISSFQLGEAPLLSAKGGYFFLARRYTMMRIKMISFMDIPSFRRNNPPPYWMRVENGTYCTVCKRLFDFLRPIVGAFSAGR